LTRNSRSAPENPGVPRAIISRSTLASGPCGCGPGGCPCVRGDRARYDDAAIEAARAEQCGIEDVGPVRGGDDDDAVVGLESRPSRRAAGERLLALVVTAAEAGTTVATHSVDLVDKDDAGGVLLALLEEIADAAGADADEHLDEVRAADREERHAGLTAIARASNVLPVPGGPIIKTPLGMRPPRRVNFFGSLRNAMISSTSSLASSTPATSLNVTRFW